MSHALHIAFIPALLIGIVSMAARDFFGVVMMVAESRSSCKLAGHMDALGDGANIFCQVVGAGTVILTGFTWHALVIIAAILVTSDIGTRNWTRIASQKVPPDPKDTAVLDRLERMEAALASLRGDPVDRTDESASADA